MRPLKLEICAFGPYAHKQTIDFCELKDRKFFLIHGPTGSGKTTILDAICFALYGDTSGAERNGKQMCSHHADLDLQTEVTLEFAIGEKMYRVWRSPEQERAKKRGEGTVLIRSEASLWRINDLTENNREDNIIASGWTKVTEKMEEMLGFKSQQFRQVVLLPQGEFRKLLTASSTERQQILETLFKTEYYRKVEESLKQSSKELRDQYKQLTNEHDWTLKAAKVENIQELQLRLSANQQARENARDKYKQAKELEQEAQNRKTKGQEVINKLEEKAKAERELSQLEEQKAHIEAKRQQYILAQKAAKLVEAETMVSQRKDEVKVSEAKLITWQEKNKEINILYKNLAEKYEEEKNKEVQREEASKEYNALAELTDKVKVLATEKEKAVKLHNEKEEITQVINTIKSLIVNLENELEQNTVLSNELIHKSSQIPLYEQKLVELKQNFQRKLELVKLEETFAQCKQKYTLASNKFNEISNKVKQQKLSLARLQELWSQGQAAVLAGSLQDNQPCPVCGSLEHPQPKISQEQVPTQDEIKKLQFAMEKLEATLEQERVELEELASIKTVLETKVSGLKEELASQEGSVADLQQQITLTNNQLNSTQKDKTKYEQLLVQNRRLKEKMQHNKQELEAIEKGLLNTMSAYENAKTIVHEREKEIPENLRQHFALEQAQIKAQEKLKDLKEAWELVQRDFTMAGQKKAEYEASLKATQETLDTAQLRLKEEERRFALRLTELGFTSTDEYVLAKELIVELGRVEQKLKAYDENLHAAKQYFTKLVEETKELATPNMNQLNEQLERAQEQLKIITEEGVKLKQIIEQEEQWSKELISIEQKLSKVEKEYSVLGKLSDVANGQNDFGITFQRFVLGALLDDVTAAATERLKLMSKGRYHLQRSYYRARSNAAAGLELEILDNYTGVPRGVATLSGGETFLASLALALGLADVVQSYAGGIHLDTIFIDEGFGTLDPESLDFAIRSLIDLQKGGRMVGIISHVPELKERIDARLEVIPTQKGSVATFKLE